MTTPQELVGTEVYDQEGQKVGRIGTVYLNEESHQPEWVTVRTGLFGHKESFVPLAGAETAADGLHVGWAKDMIKDAPHSNAEGRLSTEESTELYRHYGLPTQRDGGRRAKGQQTGQTGRAGQQNMRTDQRIDERAGQRDARKNTGRTDDHTMTRSEERLEVGTERVESGRVHLRKYVVTEEQQVSVPVTHEEVRLVREPMARGEKATIAEDDQEIVLHEDRPVVQKKTVPVEKVSAHTEQVTEQRNVSGTVRQERIEVDDSTAAKNKKRS